VQLPDSYSWSEPSLSNVHKPKTLLACLSYTLQVSLKHHFVHDKCIQLTCQIEKSNEIIINDGNGGGGGVFPPNF
jgi:hypothetical protein